MFDAQLQGLLQFDVQITYMVFSDVSGNFMHAAPLTNKSYITNTIHVAKVSALSYVSGDFGSFMNWRSTCQMLRLAQSASRFKQTVRFGIFISSPQRSKGL